MPEPNDGETGYTLPEACPRGRNDCQPLNQIIYLSGGFICCGLNDVRSSPGDIFRHCWKNKSFDEMSDWDRRDIVATIAVLSGALAVHENIVINKEPDDA